MVLRYIVMSAVLFAAVVLLASMQADGQAPVASPSATVNIQPNVLRLDGEHPAEFSVIVTPPPGDHAYLDAGKDGALLPVAIDLDALAQGGLQVQHVSAPQGQWDAQFGATVLRGEGVFRYQLTAPSRSPEGTRDYAVTVRSQVCDDTTGACYFPHTTSLSLRVAVLRRAVRTASGPVTPGVTAPTPLRPSTTRTDSGVTPRRAVAESAGASAPHGDSVQYTPRTSQPGHGLLVWMLLAFVAGLVLNVMPCVLPVVSIKVLSFVQQAGESRRRVLAMGLVFAAGMLTVFLALAAVAILFGLGWGQQFQSQAFLIILITLVFAFALSLFGVYDFAVPTGVNALAAATTREGFASVYLKGVLATLLATPCSGPFLGSTMAWTLTQPPSIVLLMFSMLGLGMAMPYVVLTAHPESLTRLPKPGAWMETFKQIMGFLLMGTVAYLMISPPAPLAAVNGGVAALCRLWRLAVGALLMEHPITYGPRVAAGVCAADRGVWGLLLLSHVARRLATRGQSRARRARLGAI